MHRRGVAAPVHQLVGLAGHGRHDDGDIVSGVDFALDVTRDVADSVDIGDGRTAEFHHEAAHDDACIPCEDKLDDPHGKWSARAESGVYIAARSGASNQLRFRPKNGANGCGGGLIQGRRMGRYIDEILQPARRCCIRPTRTGYISCRRSSAGL